MTLEAYQAALSSQLQQAGIEQPSLEARLLVQHALGMDHTAWVREAAKPLDEATRQQIEPWLARRLMREPMSQILGYRDFWKDRFCVSDAVLSPRGDSEALMELVLNLYPNKQAPLRLLELGVGSGCLILSLLGEYPNATADAVDRSEAALAVASHNARMLQRNTRLRLICADWMQTLQTRYDMIISNPPYITAAELVLLEPEVRDYEPRMALCGGDDGLQAYRQILQQAPSRLAPGGHLVLELGAGQHHEVMQIAAQHGFAEVARQQDMAGIDRALALAVSGAAAK